MLYLNAWRKVVGLGLGKKMGIVPIGAKVCFGTERWEVDMRSGAFLVGTEITTDLFSVSPPPPLKVAKQE